MRTFRLMSILALLALTLSAVACGSTEPPPLPPTAAPSVPTEVPATAALSPTEVPPTAPEATAPPPIPTQVTAIHDFLYQLQNLDLEAIGQTGYAPSLPIRLPPSKTVPAALRFSSPT
jgi:hypothetical protein